MKEYKFHTLSIEETFKLLNSSPKGLNSQEAEKRLKKFGLNELEEKKESKFLIFIRQFNNPLVYILIVASIITFFMGDYLDSGIIAGIILINGFLGFLQELKAQASLEALKKLTQTKTTVLRDGKEIEIPVSQVVPGDIVILGEGDVVPADIRLIETAGLLVDEAILTGESIPVEKDASVVLPEDTPVYKRVNILFKGTLIVRGKGKGIVYATGKNTEIGKIAEKVKEKSPETPLQRSLKVFSKKWIFLLIGVLSVIFVIGILQGRDFYTLFLLLVSELVSSVPEGLPLVVTFILVIGALRLAKKKTLVKYLPSVETLGSATFIVSDKTGTITEGKLQVKDYFTLDKEKLLLTAALCNDAFDTKGDPLEVALLKWLENQGFNWRKAREKYKRIWEHPFDTKLRLMATINEIDGKKFLFIKGAFESLINFAINDVSKLQKVHDEMAENGLRVIAVGYSEIDKIPDNITKIKIKLIGLIGFLDPPKENVKEAVKIARKAGIRVIMVTGDNIKTATAIAKMVDIYQKGDFSLLGEDLKKYSDKELYNVLKRTSVVARATPEDKYRIVKVLQSNKEIVAVTGDGVNDVPALKVADLGIAMGSGSEAAKEVAKMIITDNNLSVIVDAIRYGRNIALNLRKTIYYLMSCSLGEIGLISSAFLLNFPLPLHPIQILWINVVTEGVQDKTFAFNKEDKDVMNEKPKPPEKTFFDKKQILDIIFAGLLMAILTLSVFLYFLNTTQLQHAIAMAFTSLIVIQWFNGFQSIITQPFFKNIFVSLTVNPYMYVGVGIGVVLQLLATYIFPDWLHTVPLTFSDWMVILGVALAFFIIIEIKKWIEFFMNKGNI
ncbi:cation-transporting P-type ATPase [Persephonella sp. KM09-Lau-8]|uniref:cation-translocating P-type ATPase n=1 Tax=Persephonella sp. KM09-Lau-8 TaxID=1158345 RepID=UPI000496DD34|nr:cation-transporting P-type ATPase [Persephonella sp. KM09-Lau-8]